MVRTIEKLQRRVKELDRKIKQGLSYDDYDFAAADDRSLLEEAVRAMQHALTMQAFAESVIMESSCQMH